MSELEDRIGGSWKEEVGRVKDLGGEEARKGKKGEPLKLLHVII